MSRNSTAKTLISIRSYAILILKLKLPFPRWKLTNTRLKSTNTPPKECHNCLARERSVTRDSTPWWQIGFQRPYHSPWPSLGRRPRLFGSSWSISTWVGILNQWIQYLNHKFVTSNSSFPIQLYNREGVPARWSWRQHRQSYTKERELKNESRNQPSRLVS